MTSRMAVHRACVWASAVLLVPAAAMAQAGPTCGPTDHSVPGGLVVDLVPQADGSLDLRAVNNPCISGVALQVHWSDLEPVQGKPDWSKLDALFAAAESSKKWVHLEIFPGFFSPAWALDGAKSEQFAMQYGPGKGALLRLPMPWDAVYLDRWLAFVKQLGDRYGKSAAFKMVAAAGPTSVSVEMTMPHPPPDLKKWQDDSYTARKYIDAYQRVFQAYAADFPNQYVSLTVGDALNIDDRGKIVRGEGLRTRRSDVAFVASLVTSGCDHLPRAAHCHPHDSTQLLEAAPCPTHWCRVESLWRVVC